ncbi:biotin--[acetyl-CoA-carboxylase] ligase [Streptomyces carpaticus]|uniref:biotin--[biotin carboxyl-carrier protein] ligase n=1 Tax=Streptomyces harbinensis TaxID=1176198 RepID=A0A1I6TWF1_9ACTN|nr:MULTISPECIES: biotin--[acetyl-CoA-carboxylase] ligase [Streptomyces]QKV70416.1 biotin--[acetyl-CoA-carboxylase] ligase [Streptomyces harbinensis]UWM50843.1 biotin--[acetyl-CoA-carboxylase] ligase [Streptomyces carpaticus]SFS93485.1 BirA family transcriptional regulator, biotin operon repressor / biotin-[acetyl-CoA-carboxylase] ligase [Streptomyces harbinensis]
MTPPPGRWSDLDRPPLNARALRTALVRPAALWTGLTVVESTGSTNADLAAAATSGAAAPGTVLVAEEQLSGRGRLDRRWNAPARSGLFVSVLLTPGHDVPAERWGWLPLLAGVAAVTALSPVAEVETALKWPNDLLVTVDGTERKLGGILAERVTLPDGTAAVVLGMGVNVSLRADELPVPTAGSLLLAGARTTDRDPLLRALLRSLADWYGRWTAAGGDASAAGLLPAYAACCATLGRTVRALLPGGAEVRGEAVALDGTGRLVIADADAVQRPVDAADIVHLR